MTKNISRIDYYDSEDLITFSSNDKNRFLAIKFETYESKITDFLEKSSELTLSNFTMYYSISKNRCLNITGDRLNLIFDKIKQASLIISLTFSQEYDSDKEIKFKLHMQESTHKVNPYIEIF